MIVIRGKQETELFTRLRDLRDGSATTEQIAALTKQLATLQAVTAQQEETKILNESIIALKKELSALTIQKEEIEERYARKDREAEELFARKERELRHMIGLEQKRQEQERAQQAVELQQAATQAKLDVQKENLVEQQKRFTEQMAFNTSRFEKVETYMKEMMESILSRLPNVNMEITKSDISARTKRT